MNLPVLSSRSVKPKDFVTFWSCFYDYPLEELYMSRIGKKQFTEDDLRKLFEWKNGSRLSQKKQKVLENIIEKINLVNALKAKFDLDLFQDEFKFVKGTIWKIYLLHIIRPGKYPIFDQHVYRAFLFISKRRRAEISTNNKQKQNAYFSEYISFFNSIVGQSISAKKLDEALWAYGKFLKTPYGRKA